MEDKEALQWMVALNTNDRDSKKLKTEEASALLEALSTGNLFKVMNNDPRGKMQVSTINVLDTDSKNLIAGKRYKLREDIVMVLRAELGGGNMFDTFQRVYYLGSDLKEYGMAVDGTKSLFNSVYKSTFERIVDETYGDEEE